TVLTVRNVHPALFVGVNGAQERRGCGESFGRGQHADTAFAVDPQDPLLVDDVQPVTPGRQAGRVVQSAREGASFAVLDYQNRAVAVFVRLAGDRDVNLAVGAC